MPKRSRQPQSLFAALPADLRRQLGATPQPQVKTEPADDEYIDPIAPPPSRPRNPASLLSTQPPRLESPPADTAGPSNDNEGAVKLSSSRNASWVQQPRTARTETHGCSASAIAPQPPPLAAAAAASTSTSVVAVKRTREEWEQSFAANNKRQKTDAQAEANGGKKAKRGKKQNKDDEAENPYLGHPWDCTGLVPRYTDAKEVPDYLKKCKWELGQARMVGYSHTRQISTSATHSSHHIRACPSSSTTRDGSVSRPKRSHTTWRRTGTTTMLC